MRLVRESGAVANPPAKEPLLTAQPSDETRQHIMAAALDTLREEGIAGTSARSIARNGDFSQAAIFYHFGSVEQLLVDEMDLPEVRLLGIGRDPGSVPNPGSAVGVVGQAYVGVAQGNRARAEADVDEGRRDARQRLRSHGRPRETAPQA